MERRALYERERERERLSSPPGPLHRRQNGFTKTSYTHAERAAFAAMPAPYMLTLCAKRRLSTSEWLELVLGSLTGLGSLQVDCFRQHKDRSCHVAIYGLPHGEAANVICRLWKLCRALGGRKGRRTRAGRRSPSFLLAGLALSYAWSHDEISSGTTTGAMS